MTPVNDARVIMAGLLRELRFIQSCIDSGEKLNDKDRARLERVKEPASAWLQALAAGRESDYASGFVEGSRFHRAYVGRESQEGQT